MANLVFSNIALDKMLFFFFFFFLKQKLTIIFLFLKENMVWVLIRYPLLSRPIIKVFIHSSIVCEAVYALCLNDGLICKYLIGLEFRKRQ